MKLRYTIMYVPDVAKAVLFYRDAFGLEIGMQHEGGDYAEMETGVTRLAFSSVELMRKIGKNPGTPDPKAPVFEIAFETDDVTGSLETAIAAGATLLLPATQQPWGQTIAYVSDLNGYLVEICSPVSP